MSTITNSTTPSATFEELLDKMLPHFRYFAKKTVKRKGVDCEDIIQDLCGMALETYLSLIQRGQAVFYTPLMKFAIRHYIEGRRFTGSNTTDILAEQAQKLGRSDTCQLSTFEDDEDTWDFMSARQTSVADAVQFKIDYEDWYCRQSSRDQEIIWDLALGETATAVAKKHGVSAGLISIKRKNFAHSWKRFIDPLEYEGSAVPA
jgi:DNA-directed RNA polymerase specialized sigma24 family protein